jgi:uncharacterized protein YndB with AHSA1/START domain
MPGIDSYHADLTIDAPIDSVFAAVSSVEALSGWWTTDTGGSPEPGGELRFTFSDGAAVMLPAARQVIDCPRRVVRPRAPGQRAPQ